MWTFVKYSSVVGLLMLALSFFAMGSAPQQAAAAAIGIGLAVIPYCLARANDFIAEQNRREIEQELEDFDR